MKESEYWAPKMELMPQTELKELQTKRVLWITRYAYQNSRFYHRLYDEANVKFEDIKTIEDFRKNVPFFIKDDIRAEMKKSGDPFGGILVVPKESLINIHPSTGTTGLSTFMPFTRDDYEQISKATVRNVWMAKMRPGMKIAGNSIGWHWYAATNVISFDRIGPREAINACIPHAVFASYMFNAITRLKPDYCIAVLDIMLGINDICRRLGIDPAKACESVKYVLGTMGEAVTKKLRQTVQDSWGVKDLFDAGGIGDGLYPICDCHAHDGFHSWMDLYHIELMDEETRELLPTGERGEYLITNLIHKSHPYVRFATEDYAEIFPEKCECGRTHERIRVLGRMSWTLHVAGKKITTYDVHRILEKLPEMPEATFTMIKYADKMDELRLRAVYDQTKTKDPGELKKRAETVLKKELGVKAVIEWITYDEIPKIFHKIQRLTDLTKQG